MFLGHCLKGEFKVFLVSHKLDYFEALAHCLERGFEVFLVSDKLDHLETNRRRVHIVWI